MNSDMTPGGKLRIMQVIPDLRIGGAERVAVTLANGFAERGHEVMLVGVRGGGPQEENVRQDLGVQLRILGIQRASVTKPFAFTRSLKQLRTAFDAAVREFKPDIIQTHIPEDDLLASESVQRTGQGTHIPLIHSLNFHLHRDKMDLRGRMRLRLFRRMLQRSREIWVVSAAVGRSVNELTGVPTERMTVLHNGADLRAFENLPTPLEAREPLGLTGPAPLILGVGRLHPAKNFPMFVRASRIVLEQRPDARFAIVGEGDQRPLIEAEIEKQSVGDSWTLLGMRNDVPHCLAAADIFVQPSDWEGFPVAVVEAMAAARPLVATDVAGVGEVIRDQENGLLVEKGNAEQLAAALLRLLDEPKLAESIGASAKQTAWQNYNLDAYIRRAEELIGAALGESYA